MRVQWKAQNGSPTVTSETYVAISAAWCVA